MNCSACGLNSSNEDYRKALTIAVDTGSQKLELARSREGLRETAIHDDLHRKEFERQMTYI